MQILSVFGFGRKDDGRALGAGAATAAAIDNNDPNRTAIIATISIAKRKITPRIRFQIGVQQQDKEHLDKFHE